MEHQEILTHVYLFRGATSEDLRALAGIAERNVVIAGDRVYAEGDDPAAMFLIEMPTYLLRFPFDALTRLMSERPALALIVYRNACRYFAAHLGQVALQLDRPYF